MKRKSVYFGVALMMVSSGLTGCNELDTTPDSNYVSKEQKGEAIESQPDLATAGVVGISAACTPYGAVLEDDHSDFGWPGVMMYLDCIGPDLVSRRVGYNQFIAPGDYSLGTVNNDVNNMAWYHPYKIIRVANDVIGNIDPETTVPMHLLSASQGYADRAYMYFMLAQLFQKTYKGNESLPCVPIITDKNDEEAAAGVDRSTVQEVYDQVLSDINKAIQLLTDCNLPTSSLASVGVKRFVSLGAAYGIRARVNLVMNNWQAAVDDATKAIQYSKATPLSIAEASRPGFWDSNDHNWMWAVYVQPTDRVVTTGICNWPSMMGSFNANGYWTVTSRMISKALWDAIPDTDCRKGWWIDENLESPNLDATQQSFIYYIEPEPYQQVKIGPYQGQVGTTINSNDIPLMRVEEMYLIQAEATAMAGNPAGGKQILEDFVKTYRNPSYSCAATTAEGVQEEVWMQRRIELWGEGMCYTDLLRLNKGLDRRGGGWESVWVYNVPAPLKPFLIPNGEMEANSAITSNNEAWNRPTPVEDI